MPCIPVMTAHRQPRYKPVKDFTYWPVLVYFNNCNIIKLEHKATSSDDIEKIYHVLIYGISDNMAELLITGQYGAINTINITTKG